MVVGSDDFCVSASNPVPVLFPLWRSGHPCPKLWGAPSATAMQSINDFAFSGSEDFVEALQSLYREKTGVFGSRANDTFGALDRLRSLHSKD